jgi:predicted ATPase
MARLAPEGSRTLVGQLGLQGFLSFGPERTNLTLGPLNVFVGANGCGKSNVVEAFEVLRAVSSDLSRPLGRGGSVDDWLWHGMDGSRADRATLAVRIESGEVNKKPVLYTLTYGSQRGQVLVLDERVENAEVSPRREKPFLFFGYEKGVPRISSKVGSKRSLKVAELDRRQSVLSQYREPELYPELRELARRLGNIAIYRSWEFGPTAKVREGAQASASTERLSERFDNLPQMVSEMKRDTQVHQALKDALADLAPGFSDIVTYTEGARLRVALKQGEREVPAERLSDGTLRYLCLLAILLLPKRSSLIVIEEPELGLHPDASSSLCDLLVSASQETQLVVTTHSTVLLDALTNHANAVVAVDKDGDATSFVRLNQGDVDEHDEGLGSLWMRGAIGGVRW